MSNLSTHISELQPHDKAVFADLHTGKLVTVWHDHASYWARVGVGDDRVTYSHHDSADSLIKALEDDGIVIFFA